ncbi:MAG: amidase [Actinomycetota bacterium]
MTGRVWNGEVASLFRRIGATIRRRRVPAVLPSSSTDPLLPGPRPLRAGTSGGPLSGRTLAVKDVFDVAGRVTGAGNPTWRATHPIADEDASVVAALLDAGAELTGLAVSDELAFSLAGRNVHDGTPLNPVAPDRLPGGSSSGSAVAVASGLVDIGLGTDTAGSIRVPASYCGIVGLRPTHGRLSVEGVVPLAPSFDTVGLLTRDGATLAAAWSAVTGEEIPSAPDVSTIVVLDDLVALADREAADAFAEAVAQVATLVDATVERSRFDASQVGADWARDFRSIQLVEIWETHGDWITEHQPVFADDVGGRFRAARSAAPAPPDWVVEVRDAAAELLMGQLRSRRVLAYPTAPGPAPLIDADPETIDDVRGRTFSLTAPVGLAGLPAVSLPLIEVDGLPVGVCFVGAPGAEGTLISIATAVV